MKTIWLSFANEDTGAHLGCCIVDVTDAEIAAAKADIDTMFPMHAPGAEDIAAAIRKARQAGCNPGGQVASVELDPERAQAIPRNRLMQKDELVQWGEPMEAD